MNLNEFWAGDIFVTSTHQQWSTLCSTSAESLMTSFQNLLKRSLWNGLGFSVLSLVERFWEHHRFCIARVNQATTSCVLSPTSILMPAEQRVPPGLRCLSSFCDGPKAVFIEDCLRPLYDCGGFQELGAALCGLLQFDQGKFPASRLSA